MEPGSFGPGSRRMLKERNKLMENPQRVIANFDPSFGRFVAIHMAKLRLARLFQLGSFLATSTTLKRRGR
jgi:hypothetical protein